MDYEAVVMFEVKNPKTSEAITGTSNITMFFDENDVEIMSDYGSINVVLPGQTIGIAPSSWVDGEQHITRVEVKVTTGDRKSWEVEGALFSAHHQRFNNDVDYPKVTGVIQNNAARSFDNLRVDAITYGSEGNINGGGYAWLFFLPGGDYSAVAAGTVQNAASRAVSNLELHAVAYNSRGEITGGNMTYTDVPAQGQSEVEIYLNLAQMPDHVEIYPIISSITRFE